MRLSRCSYLSGSLSNYHPIFSQHSLTHVSSQAVGPGPIHAKPISLYPISTLLPGFY